MLKNHKLFFKPVALIRVIFITFLTIFCYSGVNAQRNEIGFMFGGTYYMGDLNPEIPFVMNRIGGGALYRFNINKHIALRANFLYGSVEGDDVATNYNETRNLHFRSTITEFSVQGEVNFLPFEPGDLETPYSTYIFGGGGLFLFNPRAELNGSWYDLKPLATEGQGSDLYPERKPYSLTSYNFLFGVGLKFNITKQITGAFEWGMRRTGTDYLDDVSTTYPDPSVFGGNDLAIQLHDRSLENRGENAGFQRGNPNVKDWYSFAGLILTFRIKNFSREICPAYN
ncbi:MAG: DUF6089 family protein [Bacteroidales bacterium]